MATAAWRAPVLAAFQGWRQSLVASGAALLHPGRSAASLARARRTLRDARTLLHELYGEGGIVVQTPPQQPHLRSRLRGLGSIETRVDAGNLPRPEIIREHRLRVEARLGGLTDARALLAAASGIAVVTPLAAGGAFAAQALGDPAGALRAVGWLAIGTGTSFGSAMLLRAAVRRLLVRLAAELGLG